MEQNPQSQLKLLVQRGKEQGYLTYAEVNDHLPEDIVDSDQIEDIIQMINDMGIQVMEEAPDADDLLLAETSNNTDEDAEEAAAQVLSSVESEIGRTTALGQQPGRDNKRPANDVGRARGDAAHGLEFGGALFQAGAEFFGPAAGVFRLQAGLLACAHVHVQADGAV